MAQEGSLQDQYSTQLRDQRCFCLRNHRHQVFRGFCKAKKQNYTTSNFVLAVSLATLGRPAIRGLELLLPEIELVLIWL